MTTMLTNLNQAFSQNEDDNTSFAGFYFHWL